MSEKPDAGGMAADDAALVLFSGGQDSTVCLAWTLERFARVETVGVAYGQRHAIELAQRLTVLEVLRSEFPRWESRLGPDHVLSLPELGRLSETALTRDAEIEMTAAGLPSTFVPGRNLLFFTYAAALGYRRGIRTLVGGMCETDYSGYPDCRPEYIEAFERLANLASRAATEGGVRLRLHTPLIDKTKAEIIQWGVRLGVDYARTWSCYDPVSLADGRVAACGRCDSCLLRKKGFREAGVDDPTVYG